MHTQDTSLGNIHGFGENSVGLLALLMPSFADLIGVSALCLSTRSAEMERLQTPQWAEAMSRPVAVEYLVSSTAPGTW